MRVKADGWVASAGVVAGFALLIALLQAHRVEQDAERTAARELWQDERWVFASSTGQPLNPNTDYHEWKQLLRNAGLREARLHDARHTAATVLLALRQPTPAVMSLMGWSSESIAARYQHVTDANRPGVAEEWASGQGAPELQAAIADLRVSLPREAAAPATSNETKTETRRPAQ